MSFSPSSSLSYPKSGAPAAEYQAFYREVLRELEGMFHGERDWIANMANAASLLSVHLPNLNWSGFYLWRGGELVVGPFIGRPACVRIKRGRGVCGTAVAKAQSILVEDVHAFPGHIACDAASASELVVPIILDGRLLGVIDMDSPNKGRFSGEDQRGIEAVAALIASATDWPAEVGLRV